MPKIDISVWFKAQGGTPLGEAYAHARTDRVLLQKCSEEKNPSF